MADIATASVLAPASELAAVEANHPQLPGLARTAPPVAIALPVPNAPKVTARALARAMRAAEFWSLALFPEAEAPVVERAAPARQPRRTYAEKWEQRWLLPELAPKRHLTVVGPDPLPPEDFSCLVQAKGCPAVTSCRHHLGATRTFRGVEFSCAVDVQMAYPHGLPPIWVAHLSGDPEGYVQSMEKTARRRHPELFDELYRLAFDREPPTGKKSCKHTEAPKLIWLGVDGE